MVVGLLILHVTQVSWNSFGEPACRWTDVGSLLLFISCSLSEEYIKSTRNDSEDLIPYNSTSHLEVHEYLWKTRWNLCFCKKKMLQHTNEIFSPTGSSANEWNSMVANICWSMDWIDLLEVFIFNLWELRICFSATILYFIFLSDEFIWSLIMHIIYKTLWSIVLHFYISDQNNRWPEMGFCSSDAICAYCSSILW